MDSDLHGHQHFQQQQQQQQQQMNSGGLTRYWSAPSSYFANLLNSVNFGGDDCDEDFNPRVSSPETDRIFQRFLSGSGGSDQNLAAQNNQTPPAPPPQQQQQQQQSLSQQQFVGSMKHEQEDFQSYQQQQQQQNQPLIYQSQSQQGHHNSVMASTSAMNDSFIPVSSMAMDRLPPMKMGGGNLARQSSSPAGFFSHVNVDNAYSVMRGMGSFGTGSGGARAESSFPSAKWLKNQMEFSSGPPSSSSVLLTRIPEIDVKSMGGISNSEDGTLDDIQTKDEAYVSGYGDGSWDDSSILSDNFLRGLGDSDRRTFPNIDLSESQNEGRSRPPSTLTHHLSLPTSSSELSAMEKLMQYQGSVPLRSRAKRGCATHPRSIAERVRRTRISERMRKLQELVPNMDKQTNTSDMLDLAVDYIKDLQKQAETLSDQRAKCTCSNNENS